MAQDIRKLFEGGTSNDEEHRMKKGHEQRFLKRLETNLPKQRKSKYGGFRIAATIIIMLGVASYFFIDFQPIKTTVVEKKEKGQFKSGISLGDLSPDLKKLENYYVSSINLELSQLEISDNNRILVESFMNQLANLNSEYQKLNTELNKIGPNDQTITAMIKNLQLRLQLMNRLKDKLNQLKSSKNETVTNTSV